jgi:hypothetical protein
VVVCRSGARSVAIRGHQYTVPDVKRPNRLSEAGGQPVQRALPPEGYAFERQLRGRPLRRFLLATDGLRQIAGVSVDEAIAKLLAFKTVAGAFLKRRALRALKARMPVDDLAMVVWYEAVR